jgi:HEAT repeat protein
MTTGRKTTEIGGVLLALAVLLAMPAIPWAAMAAAPSRAASAVWQNPGQDQDAAEREDAKREREQEKREREQEKAERLTELYDDGQEALDEGHWEQAEGKFSELAGMNGPQADGALYWKAYAESKAGKKTAALAAIAELTRRFPQSRWAKDAKALEIEVRQSSGQPVKIEGESDCELKMLAMQGAMNSDPDRALPILEKFIGSSSQPRCKDKALFVLAQSGEPKAREILGRIGRGQSNPELQRKAVNYLGIFGGEESHKILAEIYASTSDSELKRAVLRSYMIGGDSDAIFAAAKSEKDLSVRQEAIRQLGLVGGHEQLAQLYETETSAEIKRELLQAFFLSGNSKRLLQVAQTDKDPDLRRTAIRNLGLMDSESTGQALQSIYAKETDRSIRKEVLNAYFLQGNAAGLIAIARSEKDPELKKEAVQKLSLMDSKEAMDYLMEILNK